MGFVFKCVSWVGGWIAMGVLALSVSAGLYLACEIAEEYSSIVRKYLNRSTIGIIIFYVILMIDGLPAKNCLFGIFAYISYLPLLATFPFVEPISIPTILAGVTTLGNHVLWFNYFISYEYRRELNQSNHNLLAGSPAMGVMGFLFVFVWAVPLGFFISLTSMEESLPLAGGGGRKKKGMFKGFVDSLLEKKNDLFPAQVKRYQ
uniref:Uncharacterized protein n=1 Tax=Chaetoceros debilis TaxID=122233 RepID=A0A7S3VHE4_9STRA|mmetsp:Transcript_9808/g.14720  ORF Transcript_9808/g.14720 Transcript_9808/m.14720 type:complete len:204 (+) Transcript_9808:108-719(+)